MDQACPHCGFINKANALRCECCLADFDDAPMPVMAGAQSAPAAPNVSARTATVPGAPPAPAASRAAVAPPVAVPPKPAAPAAKAASPPIATPVAAAPPKGPAAAPASLGAPAKTAPTSLSPIGSMQAPAFGPDVPRTGRALLLAAIAVGFMGGLWLMRPKAAGEGFLMARLRAGRSASAPAQPASAQPVTPDAAVPKPSPVPGKNPPDIVPPSPVQQADAQAKEEEAAERQYQVALEFLDRKKNMQARAALQQLMVRYPRTRAYSQARDLLAQIPENPQPSMAAAQPAPAAASSTETPQPAPPRPLSMRERMAAESGQPANTAATAPPEPPATKRKVVIPPSLQASQPAIATQSVATSNLDDINVVSVVPEAGRVVLNVQYRLASAHSRQVFAGAWVQTGAGSRFFSYSSAPINAGVGNARIVMQGATIGEIPGLRVAFFEEGGQRFFVKDVVLPR